MGLHRLPATTVSLRFPKGAFAASRVVAMNSRKAWILKATAAAGLALACARADAQAPAPGLTYLVPIAPPLQITSVPISTTEGVRLKQALDAARSGDVAYARSIAASLADPAARKLVLWTAVDSAGTSLGFFDLDAARRDLWGWPRPGRRQTAAERSIEFANLSPQRVVEWFDGKDPETAEGAMALASAYQQLSRPADAEALIRRYWREKPFEADVQARIASRFAAYLTPDDYARRLELLLFGPQGPATKALMDAVTPEQRALADARIALRGNRSDALDVAARVPQELQSDPFLAFERARFYRKRNLDSLAAAQLKPFQMPPGGFGVGDQIWAERRALMTSLMRSGDMRAAYEAAAGNGLSTGEPYAEAEFFAGWLALKKLNEPATALKHFENIKRAGTSPITLGRALYWAGRAAEAAGDANAAKAYWNEGAKYHTAFYGQLAAEKAGHTTLNLGKDPEITPADRDRFERRESVRAARLLADLGLRDQFRAFVLALDDVLPTAEELALLVDLSRLYGDQDLAMRVVRAGAQRGLYLPERGYPVRQIPTVEGAPEPALIFAITRQESGFDPTVRSGVGARGMMQLMPSTAAIVARKLGMDYSPGRLDDPEYNMRLGSAYLGEMVQTFSGSYVMAAAGYNAGPGRPAAWVADCTDPRAGTTDPSDFIECIPFTETRNYVMRIMEGVQVYRARMNGGVAPLTAMADLKRGGWGAAPPPVPYDIASIGPAPYESRPIGSGPGPIPYASLAQRISDDREPDRPRATTSDRKERCVAVKTKARKGVRKVSTKQVCKVVAGKGKAAKAERGKHGKAKATAGSRKKGVASSGSRKKTVAAKSAGKSHRKRS